MVFAFAVLIVWAMFLAAWAPLIGWIAIFVSCNRSCAPFS